MPSCAPGPPTDSIQILGAHLSQQLWCSQAQAAEVVAEETFKVAIDFVMYLVLWQSSQFFTTFKITLYMFGK